MKQIIKYLYLISFAIMVIMVVIAVSDIPAMNRNKGPIQAQMRHAPMSHGVADGYSTIMIDSCEYIEAFNRLAHKGNCRFCAERKKKEAAK